MHLRILLSNIFFLLLLSNFSFSQSVTDTIHINWKIEVKKDPVTQLPHSILTSDQTFISPPSVSPALVMSRKCPENQTWEVSITTASFKPLAENGIANLPESFVSCMTPTIKTMQSGEVKFSVMTLFPFRKSPSGDWETATEIIINWYAVTDYSGKKNLRNISWKPNSILASGTFFRMSVEKPGIYKIDKSLLQKIGIDPSSIDPRTLKLYSSGGGILPQNSSSPFYNDPEELYIYVEGESDGVFNDNDFIQFYHPGPDTWSFSNGNYSHSLNPYARKSGVYITYGGATGMRVPAVSSPGVTPDTICTVYDDLHFYENDLYNLVHTGRQWLGEEFDKVTSGDFNFNSISLESSQQATLSVSLAGRSFYNTGFSIFANGNFVSSVSIQPTTPTYGDPYFFPAFTRVNITQADATKISLSYNKSSDYTAKGWLDYIELVFRRKLEMSGSGFIFSDSKTLGKKAVEYRIKNASGTTVWDITDPSHPFKILYNTAGNDIYFIGDNSTLKTYIIFDANGYSPIDFIKFDNQNLHADGPYDMIILTHPSLNEAADKLANYRRGSGYRVKVINPQTIYNEFSCGMQDVTAIRNYMKMLYDKALSSVDKPKFLLILGDGSYDFLDRVKNNTNLVPTYQSFVSYNQYSFCNDEYYGTLDDGEGFTNDYSEEGLDVAVGRIPVNTLNEANNIVNKIIHYYNEESYGDWRQNVTVIGDDEDGNTHLIAAEQTAQYVQEAEPGLNINKLYLDAYEKKIVNGIPSYPDVNDELSRLIDRGTLFINYSGHGGPLQWAHENIFDVNVIDKLKNYNHLPIFMAATCDFGPFDNPELRSAGERLMLNPNGGSIAYLGTSRIANTGQNDPFNRGLFKNNMLTIQGNSYRTVGEAYRYIKQNGYWMRNFYMMGDPALDLGLPVNQVITTHINSTPVNPPNDTIKAMQRVTISGEIRDINNQLISNFNGTVYPTVFDKSVSYKTLGNSPGSPVRVFNQQKNPVFRGKVKATNGKFSFSFIVPKDINYRNGKAKISYYANDGSLQAKGYYSELIMGETYDTNSTDKTGPEINIYLDDTKFAYGGMTNQNPLLILALRDESGINSVGTGVGRSISATLDNDNIYIVNDYYQSDLNTYTSGSVRYKLVNISDGRHSLKVKAYDVLNNPGESSTEFVVAQDASLIIKNLLNFPNPFTSNTTFHFDHNKPGENLQVHIEIISITGQVIKNLYSNVVSTGSHYDYINWDGKDDFGDPIGRGVYLYKITVGNSKGETIRDTGKLVILK